MTPPSDAPGKQGAETKPDVGVKKRTSIVTFSYSGKRHPTKAQIEYYLNYWIGADGESVEVLKIEEFDG